jgi:hypothetical protein
VEENDYTVFTRDDLEFELGLVKLGVAKKIAFIDNQVSCREIYLEILLSSLGWLTFRTQDRFEEYVESYTGAVGAV